VAKACDEKLAKAQAEIAVRDESLAKAQSMIDALRSQVASLKKMLFGKKSERFVDDPTPVASGPGAT
jgi:Tfp pilus assembly protein FimV